MTRPRNQGARREWADVWLADVEATVARLTAMFNGALEFPPDLSRPLTYAQQANEDRAAAIGEQRRDGWQDADPFGKEADRAAAAAWWAQTGGSHA